MQASLRAVRALVVATLLVAALERGVRTEPFASAASRDLDVRCAARFAYEAPSLLLAWVNPRKAALENTTREAVMQRDIDSLRGAAARKATEATRLRAGVADRRAQASVMLQRANASRALIEQKKQAQSTLEIASNERKLAYVAQILVAGEGLSAEEAEAKVVAHFKAHVASGAIQQGDVSLSGTSSDSSQLGAWASFKAYFVDGGDRNGDKNGGRRDGDRDGDDGPTTPTAVVLPRQNTSTSSSSQQQPTSPASTPSTSSPPLPPETGAHELPSASSFVMPWAAARVLGVEIAALEEDVHAAEARALELRFGSAEGGVSVAGDGRSSETGEDAEVNEGAGTEVLAERAERVGAEAARLLAEVGTRVDAMHAQIRRRIWSDAVSAGRACLLQRGLILSTTAPTVSATSSDATAATAAGSPEDTAWWVVEVQLLVRSLQAAVVAVAVAIAVAAAFASSSSSTSTHTGSPSAKASDGGEAIVDKDDGGKEEDVTGADGGSDSLTGGAQSAVSGGLFLLHADSASPEQYTAYKEKVWFRSQQLDNDDVTATTLPRLQSGRKLTSTESDFATTTSPSSLAANAPCSAASPSSSSASTSSSPLTMSSLRQAAKSLTEMEGNVGRLHVVIDKREATITQLRESMKEKNAQLAARDVKVAELRGAMISMTTSTETNEARDFATSRERLADMKGAIADLEAELGSRNRDQDQSTTRIAELTQSVADIGNELAQRMVDISSAAAIIGRKDTVIAKMQSMLDTYEEEKRAAWGGNNVESWSPTRRSEELSDGVDEGGGEGEGEGEGETDRVGSEAAGGALDHKYGKNTRVWDAATRQRVAPPKEGRHFRNLLERDGASTTNEPLHQQKAGYHTPPANRTGGGRRIVAPPMSAPPVRVPRRAETVQSRSLRTPPAPPPHDPFAFGRRVTMGERVHHHLSPDSSMGTPGGIDRGQISRTHRASSIKEAAAASSSRSGSGSPSKPSTSINASSVPSNSNSCGVDEAARRRRGEGSPHTRLEQLNNVLKERQEGKRGTVDASSGDSGEHENTSRAQEARQLGLRYPVQRHTRGSFGYGRGFYWECCKCKDKDSNLCCVNREKGGGELGTRCPHHAGIGSPRVAQQRQTTPRSKKGKGWE